MGRKLTTHWTIEQRGKALAGAIIGLALLAVIIAALAIGQVRYGGPLHGEQRAMARMVAGALPASEQLAEPWVEVNLLRAGLPQARDSADRLQMLKRAYDARAGYGTGNPLAADVSGALHSAQAVADAFWATTVQEFLPAVERGDTARQAAAYAELSRLYAEHRKAAQRLAAVAQRQIVSLDERGETMLMATLFVVGALVAVLLLLLVGFGRWIIAGGIRPLSQTARVIGRGLDAIAAGDLNQRIDDPLPHEFEYLRTAFNSTISSLATLLGCVQDSIGGIQAGSGEIRAETIDLATRTEAQADSIRQTVDAMQAVTAMVEQGARGTAEVSAAIVETKSEADAGSEIVTKAKEAMDAIERSSQEISQIINVIDGIAFQTNLLALNAGVEAARAGDAGKGFAVVANEVRALAQRSADAARDIKNLIAVSSGHVQAGVERVDETGVALGNIAGRITNINGLLQDIAKAAEEQSTSVAQINSVIRSFNETTQQNAAMAEQCTSASDHLTRQAQDMVRLISHFRVAKTQQAVAPVATRLAHLQPMSTATSAAASPGKPASAPVRSAAAAPMVAGSLALKPEDEDWDEF